MMLKVNALCNLITNLMDQEAERNKLIQLIEANTTRGDDLIPEFELQAEKERKRAVKEAQKQKMLLEKKLDQGISTLEKMEERNIKELVSETPTENIIFIYFGVGGEQDCRDLEVVLDELQYDDDLFDMFPGFPHAFLEFSNVEKSIQFMSKLNSYKRDNTPVGYREIHFKSKPKTAFFFYSKIKKSDLNQSRGNDLPNAEPSLPIPGLKLILDFITPEEEKAIISEVDKREWHKLATRRVQHDGYEFVYGHNNVNPNNKLGPLPEWIQPVQHKLEMETDKINGEGKGLDQLTINDYMPGDGIPPHIDAISPFEEAFAAVSMLSGSVMNFRHPDGRQINCYLPPRSAMIFAGEGRLYWQHSIACRKIDRVNGKLVKCIFYI